MKTADIQPNQAKALFVAKRHLAEFVCDAVNLEGIPYTLPEIQTLLEGITVGGHHLSDERIALNQSAAWKKLFGLIEKGQFTLSKTLACELHAIAGFEESLRWGEFRKGAVTIAGTPYVPPPASELNSYWDKMTQEAQQIDDIYDRAIFIFLQMARYQFFYDVNKRMGRFMMNGILLSEGYPAINLLASKQLEFNQLMLNFYSTGDVFPMTHFMRNCLDPRVVQVMNEGY